MTNRDFWGRLVDHLPTVGHRQFIIILSIFTLLALTYSLVLPLGEAADEAEHFALIRFITEKHRPPLTLAEQDAISSKGDASPIYHSLVALLTQHVDVSNLSELPDPRHRLERAIPYDRLPIKGLYHTEDEAFPFRGIVLAWHLARLISIPLAISSLIAVYITMLAIYPERPFFALAAVGFVAFIPRFVINSAIVSDDNLVIPLIAFALYYLVRLAQGDERRRTLIMLGLLMGLAAMTKYHSLLLVPEMTLVLLVLGWRNRWSWQTGLRRWGLTMLAFLLISAWWFAFVLVKFNQVAEMGWASGLVAALGDPVITAGVGQALDPQTGSELGYEPELGWLPWANLLFRTFWFRYGRGHVIDSPVVNGALGLIALVAALGLVVAGVRVWRKSQPGALPASGWRLEVPLLAVHILLYLTVVVARYLTLPTRETAQGRHLYPALTAIAFFFILGLAEIPTVLSRLGSKFRNFWRDGPPPAFDKFLAAGVNIAALSLAGLTLPLFIIPVYYPYLPISTIDPGQAPIQHRLTATFAGELDFKGYSLAQSQPQAGQALPVNLYWYAATRPARDYLVKICLHTPAGEPVACHQGHPAGGRYPMRAWEPGYLIRDEVYLPTPSCLPPGDYELRLAVLPLRLDTAATVPAKIAPPLAPLSLGWVTLLGAQERQPPRFEVWVAGKGYSRGEIEVQQIRQTVTVINYGPVTTSNAGADEPLKMVQSAGGNPLSETSWLPAGSEIINACQDGMAAFIDHFVVGPDVKPGSYHPALAGWANTELQVTVQTRPRNFKPPANISTRVNASFGGQVELLGYNLDLAPRWPGQSIDITVYWRSTSTMGHRYVGSFHLLDHTATMWGQIDHILGNDYEYPNTLWAPGEVISQVYRLPLNRQTPPGLYTLEFGLYHQISGNFDFLPVTTATTPTPVKHLYLGPIRVMDPAQSRPPAHQLEVNLGDQIQLLGYDLASSQLSGEEPLRLALHWQAINRPATDYTVFVQLVGPDGQVWGQQDNQPQAGRYPTTQWALRDRVVDRYELPLPEGAPPGQYRLLVGMYNLATGERLPAITQQGHHLPDNAILLATLTVGSK